MTDKNLTPEIAQMDPFPGDASYGTWKYHIRPANKSAIVDVSPEEASRLIRENAQNDNFLLIDFRTPLEHRDNYIFSEGKSMNINYYDEDIEDIFDNLDKSNLYLIYCRSGNRTSGVTHLMRELEFENIYHLAGGILQWKKRGLETHRKDGVLENRDVNWSLAYMLATKTLQETILLLDEEVTEGDSKHLNYYLDSAIQNNGVIYLDDGTVILTVDQMKELKESLAGKNVKCYVCKGVHCYIVSTGKNLERRSSWNSDDIAIINKLKLKKILRGQVRDTSRLQENIYFSSEGVILENSAKGNLLASVSLRVNNGFLKIVGGAHANIKKAVELYNMDIDSIATQKAIKTPDAVPQVGYLLSGVSEPSPFAKELAEFGFLNREEKMLALASGNGIDEFFFSEVGVNVTMTDNNNDMLFHLKRLAKGKKSLDVASVDFSKILPFEDKHFNYVYFRLGFLFLSNSQQESLLREIYRILKPGGKIFFQTKSINDQLYIKSKKELIDDGMYYFPEKGSSRNHSSVDGLKDLLSKSGFTFGKEHIFEHREKLYTDDFQSTLIRAIGFKPNEDIEESVRNTARATLGSGLAVSAFSRYVPV